MEAWISYIIPIFVAVFGGGLLLFTWLYARMRMRWHEKGILDIRYDGQDPKQNPKGKTIFYYKRKEREYDREMERNKSN